MLELIKNCFRKSSFKCLLDNEVGLAGFLLFWSRSVWGFLPSRLFLAGALEGGVAKIPYAESL